MANQQRPDRDKYETNGFAKDINLENAARQMERHPILQGYVLLGVGAVLALFSLGFFPLLKWGLFAAGIALAIWGAAKSHLVDSIANLFESIRKRF